MSVCLFNCRVLSSSAFMMVGPRIAALDAATMTKSLPVMPKRTSLVSVVCQSQVTNVVKNRSISLHVCSRSDSEDNEGR